MIDQRQMQIHVPVVGWLYILSNAGLMLAGLFVFVLLGSIGLITGDRTATSVLATVGALTGISCIVLSLPGLAAGFGLLAKKQWGRVLSLVVAFFSLVSFPIGTIVGIYALIVLLQDSANEYFSAPSA